LVLVDINNDLKRIVSRINNYLDLVDPTNKVLGERLRLVKFGDPDNNLEQLESMIPYCYVTTADAIQGSNYGFGVSTNNILNYTTLEYHITIVANSLNTTENSQKSVYDFVKNMRQMAEEDPTMPDPTTVNSPTNSLFWTLLGSEPGSFTIWENEEDYEISDNVVYNGKFYVCIQANTANDGDPIFSRSIIADIPYNTETRGKIITSITLVLSGTVGSLGTITAGSLGTIQLLSEPPDQDAEDFGRHYNDKRVMQGLAPLGNFRLYFIEIEALDSSVNYFRTQKEAKVKFEITVTDSQGNKEVFNVHTRLISKGTTINSVPTALITFEIVP